MSAIAATIPAVGFGLWKVPNNVCADTVYEAIKTGYRHIDSASDYGNEKQTGKGIARAIKDGLCSRKELWITSKIWNTYHAKEHVNRLLHAHSEDLQLDYLDLYMIHFPIAQAFVPFEDNYPPGWTVDPTAAPKMTLAKVPLSDTWSAMEVEALVTGKHVKHIGICNYNTGLLHDLMNYATIKPHSLQIASHPISHSRTLDSISKTIRFTSDRLLTTRRFVLLGIGYGGTTRLDIRTACY